MWMDMFLSLIDYCMGDDDGCDDDGWLVGWLVGMWMDMDSVP